MRLRAANGNDDHVGATPLPRAGAEDAPNAPNGKASNDKASNGMAPTRNNRAMGETTQTNAPLTTARPPADPRTSSTSGAKARARSGTTGALPCRPLLAATAPSPGAHDAASPG